MTGRSVIWLSVLAAFVAAPAWAQTTNQLYMITWKKNDVPDTGLIAQELAPVYPDLVIVGPDKMLSIKYISLIAPLIASVQELKKRDDMLEDDNESLRRDFEAYKHDHP
jgi:hypothetical protein